MDHPWNILRVFEVCGEVSHFDRQDSILIGPSMRIAFDGEAKQASAAA